jgi:hypothetical protein
MGWVDVDPSADVCGMFGNDHPHVLHAWQRNGAFDCTEGGANLTSSQADGFGVADQNGDADWSYTHDGDVVFVEDNMGFTLGVSVTNAERHNDYENARALFNGLRYMSSDGWHSWSSSHCYTPDFINGDPDWNNQLLSATEVQVTQNPYQC